ncbi:hypothetical protein ZOD2009_00850 [Haladaptatus paucihalophilus DX253]|uniref:Uncharacterized protein n=1 Tax=Haladaptatus paucihalophilus DX253 TaxID=797209 RepID=E7QNZ4_HALPU|nr:hypothetical protein ZOD2009_00850 [Haladaptatus paucihalophilus DX253]
MIDRAVYIVRPAIEHGKPFNIFAYSNLLIVELLARAPFFVF